MGPPISALPESCGIKEYILKKKKEKALRQIQMYWCVHNHCPISCVLIFHCFPNSGQQLRRRLGQMSKCLVSWPCGWCCHPPFTSRNTQESVQLTFGCRCSDSCWSAYCISLSSSLTSISTSEEWASLCDRIKNW